MSYCRWSCDEWRSAVYVYEACTGFTVHVASRKYVDPIPPTPSLADITRIAPGQREKAISVWMKSCADQAAFLEAARLEPIGLPHDGETVNFDTREEVIDYLERMRRVGYHVPQRALNALRWEINDAKEAA